MRAAHLLNGTRGRALSLVLAGALALSAVGYGGQPGLVRAQDDLAGQTAQIARSEDGVNVRAEPGFGGEVIATLSDGTTVELRIDEADTVLDDDGATRWWPIRFDGIDGWVAGYYLDKGWPDEDVPAEEPADDAEADDQADTSGETETGNTDVFFSGETVLVSAEDGANFRAKPTAASDVIIVLAYGTEVELRTDEADTVVRGGVRWWPVRFDGDDGWIVGDYLEDHSGSSPVADDDGIDRGAGFSAGEYVSAAIDEGVNVRSGAGLENETIAGIRAGDVVQVMDGPFPAEGTVLGWYLVTDGEFTGYADGDLLAVASQPSAPSDDADPVDESASPGEKFVAGVAARAHRDGTNVRSGASRDAGIVGTLDPSEVVEVLSGAVFDGRGEAWYLITNGGMTGYAHGSFLGQTDAEPPVADDTAAPEIDPQPDPTLPIAGQATGAFQYPLTSYRFTQAYGCSPFVFEPFDANLGCNFHNGIDLAANAWTEIYAADGGVVKFAGWCDCGLGYYVEIEHGNGFSTVYGHMVDQPPVFAGQAVAQGDVIGFVGSTGISTGPHIHFMLKLAGSTVDPLGYLPELSG